MNKHIIISAVLLAGIFSACQKETVSEPTFEVFTEKTTYKVGEEVQFMFQGDADFVTFFTGLPNYTGVVEGGIKGQRYEYRDRASEAGTSYLAFNCKQNNANTIKNGETLKLLVSTDFTGDARNIDDLQQGHWIDITDKAKWPTAANNTNNVASGNIDLSEYGGQYIHVALKYEAPAGVTQFGFTLSSFTLKNTVSTTDNFTYTIWNNGSAPLFGTTSNVKNEDGNTLYTWTLGTSLVCKGGSGAEALESWIVSSPVNTFKVDPDYGTLIKSFSAVVPDKYQYIYYRPGEYIATFVAQNNTVYGEREKICNINLTIEE